MKPRILVVEDHETARIGLSEVLVNHGFDVVGVAEHGKQAVSNLESDPIDAVVMDVRMPPVDGLAALESIRIRNQGLAGHRGKQLREPNLCRSSCRLRGRKTMSLKTGTRSTYAPACAVRSRVNHRPMEVG